MLWDQQGSCLPGSELPASFSSVLLIADAAFIKGLKGIVQMTRTVLLQNYLMVSLFKVQFSPPVPTKLWLVSCKTAP